MVGRLRLQVWLIPLLLVTFWLGAHGIDRDAIWGDEYWSIHDAGGRSTRGWSPVDIWQKLGDRNPWHVPGYFILLGGWGRLAGWEPPALRLYSTFWGLLAVAFTFRLGRELVSTRVGLVAAALLATSAFLAHYLHELRMYTQLAALSALTVWLYFANLRARRARRWLAWAALCLSAGGLLYTHYYGTVTLAVIGLYHLIAAPKNRRWWQVTAALAMAGALFLPWVDVLIQGIDYASSDDSGEAAQVAQSALQSLAETFSNGLPLLLTTFTFAALASPARHSRRVWWFALGGVGVMLAVNALLRLEHGARMRYFIGLWPFLALLVGLGIAQLARIRIYHGSFGRILALLILAVWMAFGVMHGASDTLEAGVNYAFPAHHVTRTLRPLAQPEDLIVNFLPDQDMRPYTNEMNQRIGGVYFDRFSARTLIPRLTRDAAITDQELGILVDAAVGKQRVWINSMPGRQPAMMARFESALDDHYHHCPALVDQADLRIDQYTIAPACCLSEASGEMTRLRFGDGIRLVDVHVPAVENGQAPVTILWALAADVPPHEYSASLQLFDSAGEKVSQSDYGLLPMAYTCQRADLMVDELAPGDYQLSVVVYHWQTGERLSGFAPATGETGEMLPLASVTVDP